MREYIIKENDENQRLDRFLSKAVPELSSGLIQKFLRKKRIKVNGKKADDRLRLHAGDTVSFYIPDAFFTQIPNSYAYLKEISCKLDILYEGEGILLLNKAPGILCQPNRPDDRDSLVTHLRAYLFQTGKWHPDEEAAFAPALCNRIDRNTGGIVLAAATAPALREMNRRIRAGQVKKYYLAALCGVPAEKEGLLEGYLLKNGAANQVTVTGSNESGGKLAKTRYRVLAEKEGLTLVECELLTGRTHQIRAQMAQMGCPLLGDVKYGGAPRSDGYQALWAYKVTFAFEGEPGPLDALTGQSFSVPKVEFVQKLFDYTIGY